jgi:hypothetical protein
VNLSELVTHYVTFRRTLGERCQAAERLLRSFCRTVGAQTPLTRIRREAVSMPKLKQVRA